ncbi:MAG: hypothetical protein JSV24_09225 [Bacteroidales bacterium]|nr:MAG: hypothetical protein JSV24_09225 [Bacteroidales bacterium]
MVRRNIIFISMILVLLSNTVFTQEVSISMTVPDRMVAGTDITVEVQVGITGHQGFARFQQELPAGITATAGLSSNADFSFEDQKVNLIWLKLPEIDPLRFNYTIHAHQTLKGSFSLGGKFSYIEEDDRDEVNLSPQIIAISPSPDIAPDLVVDIKDFEPGKEVITLQEQPFELACYRQVPYRSGLEDAWIVNLLLSRGKIEKLGRIEEVIPEGFSAEIISGRNSIFSFESGIVKFLWMQLPEDPLIVVTYKLIPVSGQTMDGKRIEGTFAYMEGETSRSIPVVERGIQLADASISDLASFIGTMERPEEKPVIREPQPVRRTDPPAVVEGVIYKVQVLAARSPVQTDTYFRPFGIQGEIISEFHEGWYKYTCGSFSTYREAREYLNQLLRSEGLSEAFICAYSQGKRIPVRTALQLTNQQWFR